jgi:hypothetical protein
LLRIARDGLTGEQPRAFVAGGLLAEEADAVATALAARFGLAEASRRHGGEWAALLLVNGSRSEPLRRSLLRPARG